MTGLLSNMFMPNADLVIEAVRGCAIGDKATADAWLRGTERIAGHDMEEVMNALMARLAAARAGDVEMAESVAVVATFAVPHADGPIEIMDVYRTVGPWIDGITADENRARRICRRVIDLRILGGEGSRCDFVLGGRDFHVEIYALGDDELTFLVMSDDDEIIGVVEWPEAKGGDGPAEKSPTPIVPVPQYA